jgi:hypothetical protein
MENCFFEEICKNATKKFLEGNQKKEQRGKNRAILSIAYLLSNAVVWGASR